MSATLTLGQEIDFLAFPLGRSMIYPGEVFYIPPGAEEDGDTKFRRHVLLANCEAEEAEVATFAYASSQSTEAKFGAANVLVNPTATKYQRTGFKHPTYVYPSRIVSVDPESIDDHEGRIIDEMPMIRTQLRLALGLGTGTSTGRGAAAGSWRGRGIRFTDQLAEQIGTPFAFIVSEPEYSKTERYQNVVPILSAKHYEPRNRDVLIADTTWLARVDPDLRESFLWTEAVFAVFHPREIYSFTELTLDDASLAELETALSIYFEL